MRRMRFFFNAPAGNLARDPMLYHWADADSRLGRLRFFSVSAKASLPLSLPFLLSFLFLSLSLRPFVCAKITLGFCVSGFQNVCNLAICNLVHYGECNARVLWMSLATVNKPSIFHSHFCSVHIIWGFVCTKPECKWNFHTKHVTSCSATQLWCTGLWSARLDSRSGPDRLGHVYRMQSPVLYRTVWGWSRSCAKVSLILLWNAVLKDEHWKKGVGRQSSYLYKKFDFAVCWWRLADTWCVLCGQDLIQAPRTAEYQKQYAAVLLELETLNAVSQGLSSVYCVSSLGLSLQYCRVPKNGG